MPASLSHSLWFNYAGYMKNNRLIYIKYPQCVNHKLYICWPEPCCTKCINTDMQHWNQQNRSLQSKAAWYIETKSILQYSLMWLSNHKGFNLWCFRVTWFIYCESSHTDIMSYTRVNIMPHFHCEIIFVCQANHQNSSLMV